LASSSVSHLSDGYFFPIFTIFVLANGFAEKVALQNVLVVTAHNIKQTIFVLDVKKLPRLFIFVFNSCCSVWHNLEILLILSRLNNQTPVLGWVDNPLVRVSPLVLKFTVMAIG
jgi:hypothetical protein